MIASALAEIDPPPTARSAPEHDLRRLDDDRDLLAFGDAQPFDAAAGDGRDDLLAAHVDDDFSHDRHGDDALDGALQLVARAYVHGRTQQKRLRRT